MILRLIEIIIGILILKFPKGTFWLNEELAIVPIPLNINLSKIRRRR